MTSTALLDLGPAVQVHLLLATGALLLGPLALGSRKGSALHRRAGQLWVLCMLGAALASLFIRDFSRPNLAGYTGIHLLALATFGGIGAGLWLISRRQVAAHRRAMLRTYLGGCVAAGVFALLPGRALGDLVWHHALALS